MELIVKQGYKQTEVGLIPEDWNVLTINDVATVIGGGTPSTFVSEYWNGNINWFTPTEIGKNKYSYQSKRKITSLGLSNSSAQILPIGTILMSTRASIGDLSILLDEATTNQGFQSLIAKNDFFNEFLYYLIQNNKSKLIKNSSGSTFLEISPNKVKSIEIPIPPTLEEQKAIATALSDVDELISKLDKLITKKKSLKQGAMQQLLTPPHKGGKQLYGFTGEWEEKRLGDVIIDFQNGYSFSASGYKDEGIPIVTMAQIGLNGQFQYDENKVNYWSIEELKILKSFTLYKGDVIMSMTDVTPEKNLIGRMTIVNELGPLYLNQRVGHLRINKNLVNPIILIHLSNMMSWRTYSKSIASLGVQANIGTTDIKNGLLWLPKIEEQNAIAEILSDMDLEIEQLESKKAKYQSVKQGMMQELLTGKSRLV